MVAQALRTESNPSVIQEQLRSTLDRLRQAYQDAGPPSVRERKEHLRGLLAMILDNEARIKDAISSDFGFRSPHETRLVELLPATLGIKGCIKHVGRWAKPRRRIAHWGFQPASAKVVPQPLGVIGIISPWNYPLLLTLDPLAAALAAGNRVMVKTSEYSPAWTELLGELLSKTFSGDQVHLVTGGPDTASAFSALPLDHLLFTGSTAVGRLVMKSAAENLTPVTLELGGKSPCVIGSDTKISDVIADVLFGKCVNAGQTCVAPDYLCIPEGRVEELIEAANAHMAKAFPSLADNPHYTAIHSERHAHRLKALLADAESKGASVRPLNPANESEATLGDKIPPTLVLDVNDDMRIMQEEIFGPLLPVKTYRDIGEVVDYINAHPRPLALYLFSRDRSTQTRFQRHTHSGALGLNVAVAHAGIDELPFGGVGASGMGTYHGREGFDTFSHLRPVMAVGKMWPGRLVYPPYEKNYERLMKLLIRK